MINSPSLAEPVVINMKLREPLSDENKEVINSLRCLHVGGMKSHPGMKVVPG